MIRNRLAWSLVYIIIRSALLDIAWIQSVHKSCAGLVLRRQVAGEKG
jgi:hypothetical protein